MLQSFVMLDVLFKLIISSYALETGRDGYYFIIRSRQFYFRVPPENKMIIFKKITFMRSKKISNDQELIQSDPISCPQNQKGNN